MFWSSGGARQDLATDYQEQRGRNNLFGRLFTLVARARSFSRFGAAAERALDAPNEAPAHPQELRAGVWAICVFGCRLLRGEAAVAQVEMLRPESCSYRRWRLGFERACRVRGVAR